MITLGLDIGSNSVGSAWIDMVSGQVTAGVSVFPAGVDESDDKRGEPKNAKRRSVRRTRITLARRAHRKRELRLRLIAAKLLPDNAEDFRTLVDDTDPWELRQRGLDESLTPHEMGRVLLHLSQRRGAMGLKLMDLEDADAEEGDAAAKEDGKVKAAVQEVRAKMQAYSARTFGEFIAIQRAERITSIETPDQRPAERRKGERIYRGPVRNKAGNYEHCADRNMIRDEFARLWDAQTTFAGETASLLSDPLRIDLDNEAGDDTWRHKGLLFGQRRQSWDLGTLGRCTLEPTERCIAHADRHASLYRAVETVNNLKVIEGTAEARPLTPQERAKLLDYLRGPLGMDKARKVKGKEQPAKPKSTVSVSDLRKQMGWSARPSKTSPHRFNIENDAERQINTDWFHREIVHGGIGLEAWDAMPEDLREGINRAVLKFDPDEEADAVKLHAGLTNWGKLNQEQADRALAAWKRRPRPDAKRLNLSRKAVRNLLVFMNRPEPWNNPKRPGQTRWLTEIEARKMIAEDGDFIDVTTGKPLDDRARPRYATGAKGATARDRYYMRKHILRDSNGDPIIGPDDKPLAEPPPAPMISNPVVRKAIHEVRRHLVAYMTKFGQKPCEVYIELAREAKMGAKDSDALLFKNRLRDRIRKDIIETHNLGSVTSTQQRAAVDRVVLAVQQGGVCPLCGNQAVQRTITVDMAASGEGCEVAHILPRASGGHNGLGNLVLAHIKCNRDMARRTPRQFWDDTIPGGFDQGMRWIEGIYGEIHRPKPSEVKNSTGLPLWKCFFAGGPSRKGPSYDHRKIAQFKKNISDADVQAMTERQAAATKYASRQVMAYLADALYDGKGLPERGGPRKIFATDGMWTSRFRREWKMFFDPHGFKAKGLDDEEEQERKEKDRGDHRHHAIDAVLIALSSQPVRNGWEQREKQAEQVVPNSADESVMDNYRRINPIAPPPPFSNVEVFREKVRAAVYGTPNQPRPICHRPVKRKLIGAFHEESLFGPVVDENGRPTGNYTAKKSVLALDPNHLRLQVDETEKQAIERLASRRQKAHGVDEKTAKKWAKDVVMSPSYTPAKVDPPPGKSGIVRDIGLRKVLRDCLEANGLDPDNFKKNAIVKLCDTSKPDGWKVRMPSGVPIKTVVLLRTMSEPVLIPRKRPDYETGKMLYDSNPKATRAYVGGNNHHVEIRVNDKGKYTGEVVTAFGAAQRKLARLRAFREADIPKPKNFSKLPPAERKRLHPIISRIEREHPLVDRTDNEDKGGRFVMSLCEGEMVWMRPKPGSGLPDKEDYFVVAKLDRRGKNCNIVMVPHWDARAATERKSSSGEKVPNSKRIDFAVTPTDLNVLAPPEHDHAIKVVVDPLGKIRKRLRD